MRQVTKELLNRKFDELFNELGPEREIAPSAPNPLGDRWLLDGQEITDTTLFEQRMYHMESMGTWTRPIGGGSQNSIDA